MKLVAIVWALAVATSFAQKAADADHNSPTELPLGARLALAKLADNHLTEDEGVVLAQTSGIAPHLVQIITRILDQPGDFEHMHKVFQVLRSTRNIPDDQMAIIRSRLTAFLNQPVESGLPYMFRGQGIYLLAENPSPVNEALLIRFLNEPMPASATDYSFIAADALGISGGPSAQAALEAYQRIHPVRSDVADKRADYAAKSIERIRARLSATNANRTSSKQNSPPSVQPSAPKKASGTKPTLTTPNEKTTSSTPWSIIVLLIVAALGLLWLLLKRRS